MYKITRSDVFARDEKGGEWFDEFVKSMANQKESSVKDVLDAIHEKKGETVQSIVEEYRSMVGLDIVASNADSDTGIVVEASFRPLSIRHAKTKTIMELLESNPELQNDIRSLCEHSGGTKNTLSIISFLRDKLGKDVISYSDDGLSEYIEEVKAKYRENSEEPSSEAGKIGIDVEDTTTDADYITHGKGQ